MSLLADEVALLKLQGLWDYGGAANAATGLASLKTAADVGTAAAGGAGIMGFDPASIIFSLALKAMGIGPSGTQATPMTPEERELFNTAQKVDMALGLAEKASTGNFDYEGQGETVEATALDAYEAVNALPDSGLEFFGDTKDFLLGRLAASGFASVPTLGGSTEPTLVEMTQEKINKAASAVGKAQDTVFDIFGIPRPDYSVIQPNAPGATVIWGEPSGGVFGRIGTTPGGTVTGVQTGIPALDILLGKVADVVSGRTAAGEVLTTATIQEIILQTAGDELGIPGDPNKILAEIKKIGSQVFYNDETGKIGIDLGDGPATPTGETPTLTTDKVPTGGGTTSTLPTGETPTLSTDRVTSTGGGITSTLPTGETPTLTTDKVPTGGGNNKHAAHRRNTYFNYG